MTDKKLYKLGGSRIEYVGGSQDALHKDFSSMQSLRGSTGSALSALTCKTYMSKINRIAFMMTNKPYESYDFLTDADSVIKQIEDSDLKGKKDYLAAISKLLRYKKADESVLAKYGKAMTEQKDIETKTRGNNKSKAKDIEKADGMTLKQIQSKIKAYTVTANSKLDEPKLVNKVLVSFYFMNENKGIPYFVPRNDLPEFKIVSINRSKKALGPEYNYLVIDAEKKPTKIIMKNYKTKSTYGTQSFQISTMLAELLQAYIIAFNKVSGDYLFTDKNNQPFKHNNFSALLENAMNEVLGSRIGVDLARQIVITNFYNDNPMATINQKNDVARAFLHSASTSSEYVRPDLITKPK